MHKFDKWACFHSAISVISVQSKTLENMHSGYQEQLPAYNINK